MSERYDLDGDSWELGVESTELRPGIHALVFHCVSNPQRPYRVVEVSADEVGDARSIDADEAERLFARSQVMDYSRDPDATDNDAPTTP